jgi:hypothetical protein
MDPIQKNDPAVLALARERYFNHMDPPHKVFGGFIPAKKNPLPKKEPQSLRIRKK